MSFKFPKIYDLKDTMQTIIDGLLVIFDLVKERTPTQEERIAEQIFIRFVMATTRHDKEVMYIPKNIKQQIIEYSQDLAKRYVETTKNKS